MAPRSRTPDAAGLGRRVWDHVAAGPATCQAQFTPETGDDVTGWLWEGPLATLIREAIPGIAGTDLRRARDYLNAWLGADPAYRPGPRGVQPQWFIRACWHQGPGGHVHVVTTARPGQVAVPAASHPVPGGQSETPI